MVELYPWKFDSSTLALAQKQAPAAVEENDMNSSNKISDCDCESFDPKEKVKNRDGKELEKQ